MRIGNRRSLECFLITTSELFRKIFYFLFRVAFRGYMPRRLKVKMQYRIKLDKSRHVTKGEGCGLPYLKNLKNTCAKLSGVKTRKKRVSDIFYLKIFITLIICF